MSALDVVLWLIHIAVLVWAWPVKGDMRPWMFWSSVCLPVLAWCWLVPGGLIARKERRAKALERERAESVSFLRAQLVTGTPVEQQNAREILALWDVPAIEPVSPLAPVLIRTTEPQAVRQQGDWLVVGGVARAHVQPPSLQRYAAGCRCPACVELMSDVQQARKGKASEVEMWVFKDAMRAGSERIVANLSIPRAIPDSSMLDCLACDVQEIHQMNGHGDICVTHVVGHTCPAHGATSINWQHGHGI